MPVLIERLPSNIYSEAISEIAKRDGAVIVEKFLRENYVEQIYSRAYYGT